LLGDANHTTTNNNPQTYQLEKTAP